MINPPLSMRFTMNEDILIVGLIVALAVGYLIYHYVRKIHRLSQKNVGACGHRCDCCPFAKMGGGCGKKG